jgi:hypothetical protein
MFTIKKLFLFKSIVTPEESNKLASKRKGETTQSVASKKTKDIRKIQNSSGYGVQANQVEIGGPLTMTDNDGNEEEEEEEDEEEEEQVPDNLSFGEKAVANLVEGVYTFQNTMSEFLASLSKQASITNTHLAQLNKKFENIPTLLRYGRHSPYSSSNSSSLLTQNDSFEQAGQAPQIEMPFDVDVDVVVNGGAQPNVPPIDANVVVVPPAAQLDEAARLIADDNHDIVGRWDRLDPSYLLFKRHLDALLNERIPRQFRHLSFKDMRLVTQTNLRSILDDIDGKYYTFSLDY